MMPLVLILLVSLVTLVSLGGWVGLHDIPASLADMPTPMVLFIALGALILAVLAWSGRSHRL
jgi:hypothetical protein